ncbi:UNVERIFIED_CONTAM: hypothetical protein HDU68_006432, partial [Siphonaria sp. JEL0065]
GNPNSIIVGRDVAFIEDQFNLANIQPLIKPISAISWFDFWEDDGTSHDPDEIATRLKAKFAWDELSNQLETQSLDFDVVEDLEPTPPTTSTPFLEYLPTPTITIDDTPFAPTPTSLTLPLSTSMSIPGVISANRGDAPHHPISVPDPLSDSDDSSDDDYSPTPTPPCQDARNAPQSEFGGHDNDYGGSPLADDVGEPRKSAKTRQYLTSDRNDADVWDSDTTDGENGDGVHRS